jgi:hypothetical protein
MVNANIFFEGSNEAGPKFENMHFEYAPVLGESVELEGQTYAVSGVIHTPDMSAIGAKLKVTLQATKSLAMDEVVRSVASNR